MLFDGVTTSKPLPSRTRMSPGAPPPRTSARRKPQLKPGTSKLRRLLTAAPTSTRTSPQAVDGTMTLNSVSEAAITVAGTRLPFEARNVTVLSVAVDENPRPFRTTAAPTNALLGETEVSTNGVDVPDTSRGNALPPIGVSRRKTCMKPLTAEDGTVTVSDVVVAVDANTR